MRRWGWKGRKGRKSRGARDEVEGRELPQGWAIGRIVTIYIDDDRTLRSLFLSASLQVRLCACACVMLIASTI